MASLDASLLALRAALGRTIQAASYEQYEFNGLPSHVGVGQVELVFTDGGAITLRGQGNGEGVDAFLQQMVATPSFTLAGGDACGFRKRPIAALLGAPWIIGATIVAADAATTPREGGRAAVGWRLHLDGARTICFINYCDDETLLAGDLPDYWIEHYERFGIALEMVSASPEHHPLPVRRR